LKEQTFLIQQGTGNREQGTEVKVLWRKAFTLTFVPHIPEICCSSFIGTDLSKANLQDTCLSGAKLVQTLLDATDFTGSILTGAYIQDWGITRSTNFDGVECEYIYMRLPTKDDPDPHRKPDNRIETFTGGEFKNFIQPIFDTLDIYHNQEIDPRAIVISFKQLKENHPDAELEIISVGQQVLLKAKTRKNADKEMLGKEYFDTYKRLVGLPEQTFQILLAEKDSQIRRLETMLMIALERPNLYSSTQIEKVDSMGNIQGYDSTRNLNISGGTINASGAGALSLGDISGTVANTIKQLPSSSEPNKPGIKELLEQLKTAIESESSLSDEDKADALEHVQTLAEVGQKPKELAVQKPAKVAIQALKGIFSSLPDVARLVEASKTLIPLIAHIFGL